MNMEAVDTAHPIFDGITLDGSDQFAYCPTTAFDEYVTLDTAVGNATLLGQATDGRRGDGVLHGRRPDARRRQPALCVGSGGHATGV